MWYILEPITDTYVRTYVRLHCYIQLATSVFVYLCLCVCVCASMCGYVWCTCKCMASVICTVCMLSLISSSFICPYNQDGARWLASDNEPGGIVEETSYSASRNCGNAGFGGRVHQEGREAVITSLKVVGGWEQQDACFAATYVYSCVLDLDVSMFCLSSTSNGVTRHVYVHTYVCTYSCQRYFVTILQVMCFAMDTKTLMRPMYSQSVQ